MEHLVANGLLLAVRHTLHRFECWGIFGHKGTLDQAWGQICELMLFGKGFNIADELVVWNAGQGVLDSTVC